MARHSKHPNIDLVGQRFGRLVVISLGDRVREKWRWHVQCDCGEAFLIHGNNLRTGNTKSCGCLKRDTKNLLTHGLSKTRAHGIWKAAKQRCFNVNAHNYRHYGGRGITMCDQWRDDFAAFYADMGECPPGLSLERNDVNRGYEPGNCRWASQVEQVKNTSRNVFVEHDGRKLVLKDYAREMAVNPTSLRRRMLINGETAHDAARRLIERRLHRQSIAHEVAA